MTDGPAPGYREEFRTGAGALDQGNSYFGAVCGKCGATRVDQQIGLEETPELWVQSLVEVFREVKRVLRADGTLWLEIGDSYASNRPGGMDGSALTKGGQQHHRHRPERGVLEARGQALAAAEPFRGDADVKPLMHLDGCHFYVWVAEDGRLTFDEREGDNLAIWAMNDCARCGELRRGATRIHEQRNIYEISDDVKGSLLAVMEAIADIPGVA